MLKKLHNLWHITNYIYLFFSNIFFPTVKERNFIKISIAVCDNAVLASVGRHVRRFLQGWPAESSRFYWPFTSVTSPEIARASCRRFTRYGLTATIRRRNRSFYDFDRPVFKTLLYALGGNGLCYQFWILKVFGCDLNVRNINFLFKFVS